MEKAKSFLHLEDKIVYPAARKEGAEAIASMLKKLRREKTLSVGINSTNRAIVQGKIKMVVLTNEANPPSLNDHILYMCAKKKIPVISMIFTANELGKELELHSAGTVGIKDTVSNEIYEILLPYSEVLPLENFHLYQ